MQPKRLIDRLIDDCDALRAQLPTLRTEATATTIAPIREKIEMLKQDVDELEAEVAPGGNGTKGPAAEKGNGHDKPKTAYELAKELGVIGVYKDAPSDLSTNKDYFEGFGRD